MKSASFRMLALLVTMFAPQAALAAGGEVADDASGPVSTLDLTYTLYIGGISLGNVTLSTRLQGEGYRAVSQLETSGVVNSIWRAKIEASSNGDLAGGRVKPKLYDAFSLGGQNPQRREMTLTYGAEVPTVKANRDLPDISDADKKATLDPVSAMVTLVTSAEINKRTPCGLSTPVFDGRRRYDVSASFLRNSDIRMDNGLYAGQVQVCRLKYKPISGARQRLLEGNNIPDFFAWVTNVQSTADPTRQYILPLRIWTETEFGLFVALATRATLDGKQLGRPG